MGEEQVGYYGTFVYQAGRAAHAVQHFFGFVLYSLLIPVFIMIFCATDRGEHPLSATVWAIVLLCALFFTAHILQWAVFLMQDVFHKSNNTLQDTVIAAQVSVSLCPLVGVLFVACRVRALQISQQEGNPPYYAQDAMAVCVFATVIQVFCCLMLPLFTGAASTVDEDGHSTYDLKPMVGAYAVTVVKYVSLMALHLGVTMVSVAIFTMTPDSVKIPSRVFKASNSVLALGWTGIVFLIALMLSSAKVIGLAVKLGIESVPESLLGVKITVAKAALSICRGYVYIGGLVVHNPATHDWQSSSLLNVDRVCVKINMWRLMCSLGRVFEVTTLVLEGVDVNYEKSIGSNSNIQEVIDHVAPPDASAPEPAPEPAPAKAPEPAPAKAAAPPAKKEEGEQKTANSGAPEVRIFELGIKDIGAGITLEGRLIRVEIGNLDFPNFMDHLEGHAKRAILEDIVGLILKTILKTVLSNSAILKDGLKQAVMDGTGAIFGRGMSRMFGVGQ
eukprot:gnl/TRDRNA2_/TRDRNA2_143754_c2_seq1.p1 gnl/TRDRNA2_/TRDRNA2_143754_c2~~gnl/TRDRNA2_/TRDRNA2_143754_c2_seq1.p1  ORF type:complete len:574 (+),score=92.33 gnl/TRDRNA2_/TRDRNA2_143754_c2_seq1:218-1723(+)